VLKYMLDTNIAIYTIKRRPPKIHEKFNEHFGHLCISAITLAELHHGIEKSSDIKKNLTIVEDFVSRLEVLDYNSQAAIHYGDIRATLEKKGNVIGVNDMHIAGHARSLGLVIVTNNEKEFNRIPGLRVENWIT
jgi:tRNA(fMet)-specific endonuclease VapC